MAVKATDFNKVPFWMLLTVIRENKVVLCLDRTYGNALGFFTSFCGLARCRSEKTCFPISVPGPPGPTAIQLNISNPYRVFPQINWPAMRNKTGASACLMISCGDVMKCRFLSPFRRKDHIGHSLNIAGIGLGQAATETKLLSCNSTS